MLYEQCSRSRPQSRAPMSTHLEAEAGGGIARVVLAKRKRARFEQAMIEGRSAALLEQTRTSVFYRPPHRGSTGSAPRRDGRSSEWGSALGGVHPIAASVSASAASLAKGYRLVIMLRGSHAATSSSELRATHDAENRAPLWGPRTRSSTMNQPIRVSASEPGGREADVHGSVRKRLRGY